MEEIKIRGIVLNSLDYQDSDKIVTIFSAENGIIKARVRGVKKNKAKLAFAVQPFAFVEFLLTRNEKFYTCINATSIDQFFNLTLDFDNYIFMLSCLEICLKSLRENDPEPKLFMLLLNCLKSVCYDSFNSMTVFIKFCLETLKLLGFSIEISNCAICGKKLTGIRGFSFDYNGMICSNCQNNFMFLALKEGEYAILKNINLTPFENLKSLKFVSRENMVSIISLLVKDFRVMMDIEIESIQKFL